MTHQIHEQLNILKLFGMEEAYTEQCASDSYRDLSFDDRFSMIVERESLNKENRRISSRLRQAKLKHQASFDSLEFKARRGLDKSFILSLQSCKWIQDHLNVFITGACGTGKSYLACALGHAACLQGFRVCYVRIPRLFEDLAIARGDGRYPKLMNVFARTDLLILDDWGLSVLTESQRRDLLEVLEDRYSLRSTIVTSQVPVEKWYNIIGEPTLADAILDRLIHNAYTIDLKGESMRKETKKKKGENEI